MQHEHHQEEDGAGDAVAVDQAHERAVEHTFTVDGDAHEQVGEGHAQQQGGHQVGQEVDQIPEAAPHAAFHLAAELEGHGAEDQGEQQDQQGSVQGAEHHGIDLGEGREGHAAGGDQPHFVAVPHRADATAQDRLLFLGLTKDGIEHADTKIETIEHEIHRDQNRDKEEPKSLKNRDIHDYSPSFVAAGAVSSFGEAFAAFAGGVPDMNEFEEAATGAGCSCVGPCLMKRATMRAHAMNSTR